jgi:hypothetical protein
VGVLLTLLLALQSAGAADLQVLLQPVDEAVLLGRPARVRVLIRNPLVASRTWHLQKQFWVVPTVIPMDGDLALSLAVTAPDGSALEAKAQPTILVRSRTEPEMFRRILPGEVLGVEVDLADLKFGMAAPGDYVVRATVSTDAQHWYDKWLQGGGDRKRAVFKREELFVGPLSSAPLTLRVVAGPPR